MMGRRGLLTIVSLILAAALLNACSPKLEKLSERSVKDSVHFEGENVGGMKESEILQKVKSYAQKLDKQPENAALDSERWEVEKEERAGKKVNIEKTLEMILNSAEGAKINLVTEEIKPGVTSQKLNSGVVEIGSYSTPIMDNQESRVNNIELASQKIDYKKLAPGEEFSFNRTVGKRTEAKGYEQAPIIIKTDDGYKKGFGVGGGVCQLATTLYNTVEKAGMEITERHVHSKNVGYVPKGQDATVSYGAVDFKFRNNRNFPVMIRVYSSKNTLTVKLFENRN